MKIVSNFGFPVLNILHPSAPVSRTPGFVDVPERNAFRDVLIQVYPLARRFPRPPGKTAFSSGVA
jgi:hypothetical protein